MRLARRFLGFVPALTIAGGLAAAPAAGNAASMSFTVTGEVVTPRSFDAGALAMLPQVTQSDTFRSGGVSMTDTFRGPTLQSVLSAAGGITTIPTNKNDVLRHYIVVTGADGYKAVVAAGEIQSRFGNKQDLTATSDTGGRLPAANGLGQLTSPGDVAGGRYVSQITNINVASTPLQLGTGGGRTTSFTVQGHVTNPKTDTQADLQRFTAYTESVTYLSGTRAVSDTYKGALLWDVLNAAGIVTDTAVKNDILRDVVVATGSDGYQVAFSLGELDPLFGHEPILVAYDDTAGQLGSNGTDGFARLVVPGDIAGGRYVSNLSSFTIYNVNQVPLPSSAPLFAAAIASLGAVGYRLKRRTAVDRS